MAILPILIGNYANDGTGDDLRTAFTKVNSNFTFLNTSAAIASGTNLPGGTGIFADKNGTNLEFKSLTSGGSSVTITNTSNTVNLEAVTRLQSDLNPTLGSTLNLNNHYIYGGDVQTTVYGYSVANQQAVSSLLFESNNLNLDLGGFLTPTGYETNVRGYTFDWGMFSDTPISNQLNFGTFADHLLTGSGGTLTLANNFTTIGNYPITLNTTGATTLTLPPNGTLTALGNTVSGTGNIVLSSSPTLTGTVSINGKLKVGGVDLRALSIAMAAALS